RVPRPTPTSSATSLIAPASYPSPPGASPEQAPAPASFTEDPSLTSQFGERRSVDKLLWFGPVHMLMILGATIPTGAVASLMAYTFTVTLPEADANTAIGTAKIGRAHV